MNRRGFLRAAAALPAAPMLRVLPAIVASAPAAGAVMTATEVLRRQHEFLRELAERVINPPLIIDYNRNELARYLVMAENIQKEWLK